MKEYKISKERLLRVVQDDCSDSPRDWDNLGTMVCFHSRYNLGDKDHGIDFYDYYSWDELEKGICKKHDVAVILPLYMYDHSGITISTKHKYPYNDRWDAGRIGFIFISKEKVKKEYSVKKMSKKLLERIKTYLEGEVETYDTYLRGDVYGFQLIQKETCDKGCEHEEIIDSCYGFYGNNLKENGIFDHLSDDIVKEVHTQL